MAVVSDAQRLFPSVTLRFLVKPALFQKTLRVDDARGRAAARPRLTWAASPWWGPLTSGRRGPSAQRVQSQAWAAGTLVTEPGVASARPEAWGLPSSPRPAPRRASPGLPLGLLLGALPPGFPLFLLQPLLLLARQV